MWGEGERDREATLKYTDRGAVGEGGGGVRMIQETSEIGVAGRLKLLTISGIV